MVYPFFAILSIVSAFPAQASPRFRCEPERWVLAPGMNDEDQFEGALETTCAVDLPDTSRISRLHAGLIEDARSSARVHAGPQSFTDGDLRGESFDVTVEVDGDGSPLRIRQFVGVASRDEDTLLYVTRSKKVQGQGMAGYLNKIDVRVRIEKDALGGYFFTLRNLIRVDRPWYAPTFVFEGMAKDTALENFRKARDRSLPEMAGKMRP